VLLTPSGEAETSAGEVGEVMAWPSDTLPASGDWMWCDGSALEPLDYPSIFGVLGFKYGTANGKFKLPDYRGEFLRGAGNGSGKDPDTAIRTDRGDGAAGDAVGTRQPSATHDHAHAMYPQNAAASGTGAYVPTTVTTYAGVTGYTLGLLSASEGGQHAPGTTGSLGWGSGVVSPNETRPRNVAVNYIIRWR